MTSTAAHSRSQRLQRAIPTLALTVTEAAAAVGVSDDFFRRHIAHELRWVRRGAKKLVAVSELQRWLDANGERTLDGEDE